MPVDIEPIKSELEDKDEDISCYKILSYPADYTLQGLFDKWSYCFFIFIENLIPKNY